MALTYQMYFPRLSVNMRIVANTIMKMNWIAKKLKILEVTDWSELELQITVMKLPSWLQ